MEWYNYGSNFHYCSKSVLKPYRKFGNKKLRRYKGDVSDYSWYKKVYDVMWNAF